MVIWKASHQGDGVTPRTQEKVFKKEYAIELLRIAQGDLASAQALFNAKQGRPENIGFHCQQVIEKALKAVLVSLSIPVPLVHDAGTLVAKLPQTLTPPQGYDLSQLTAFATIRRYEEGGADLTQEELQGIIAIAKAVLEWSIARFKEK